MNVEEIPALHPVIHLYVQQSRNESHNTNDLHCVAYILVVGERQYSSKHIIHQMVVGAKKIKKCLLCYSYSLFHQEKKSQVPYFLYLKSFKDKKAISDCYPFWKSDHILNFMIGSPLNKT